MPRMRTLLSAMVVALLTTSCTGGINAGEEGGLAFIVFTAMLLIVLAVLWLVLGRED
jgi:hypothetical protein